MSKGSDKIEALIESDNWKGARKPITAALQKQPESHWLLSRLALTYYEEFEYDKALVHDVQAVALAPNCPLVNLDDIYELPEEAANLRVASGRFIYGYRLLLGDVGNHREFS
jgi:hypothetical protein